MFRDIKTLEEFISDAIGNKEISVDGFLEEVDDILNRGDFIDIQEGKDLIWRYAEWPPFIDSGASAMLNIQDRMVSDSMSEQLLKLIAKQEPEKYIYDKRNKELKYKPKTKLT